MIFNRDLIFKVVCNIRTPYVDESGTQNERIGTGIFIEKNNIPFLVTASHVVNEINSSSYIIFCDRNSNPVKRSLSALNASLKWITHPVADVAILEIDVNNNRDLINGRCFPFDHIEMCIANISRDDELTCVGFPKGLGAEGKYSPFTFRTHLSSSVISLSRADNRIISDFLCLENPSVGGYSGGPVLDLGYQIMGYMTSKKEKTRLLGIIHGTLYDDTGGKIAMITPAYYLSDILP